MFDFFKKKSNKQQSKKKNKMAQTNNNLIVKKRINPTIFLNKSEKHPGLPLFEKHGIYEFDDIVYDSENEKLDITLTKATDRNIFYMIGEPDIEKCKSFSI